MWTVTISNWQKHHYSQKFRNIYRKTPCWSLFFVKLRTLNTDSNTCSFLLRNFCETPILKNICVRLLLNWLYESDCLDFVSRQWLSKPTWLSNIAKIPIAFKPELEHNSGHMPFLYLTPRLFSEPRFHMFNQRLLHKKQTLKLLGLLVSIWCYHSFWWRTFWW